jgi:hypothetical protein
LRDSRRRKAESPLSFLHLLMVVLAVLRYKQPSEVCITVLDSAGENAKSASSNLVQRLCHRELQRLADTSQQVSTQHTTTSTTATTPIPTVRTVGDDAASPAVTSVSRCRCPSCVLSYREYVIAWGRARRCQAHRAPADVLGEEAADEFHFDEQSSSCIRPTRCPPLHARLSPLVHPCINYWTVHRWFFVLQMLHWMWFTLSDMQLSFHYCQA